MILVIYFVGEMGVTNAYFGTRIYLDPGLEVIKEYRKKYNALTLYFILILNAFFLSLIYFCLHALIL